MRRPVRIGVGGPVGSGKTALVDRLCRVLVGPYELAVVTNDIYTKEDAEFLIRQGVLPRERIVSMNVAAVEQLVATFSHLDIVFVESGGDNLAATFSPELVDAHIYVIDVAEGDKIPRKGGPGITRSDLLVINKIDLAPYVGASLEVMERDARRMRGTRPFVFTDLVRGVGVPDVVSWIKSEVLFETPA